MPISKGRIHELNGAVRVVNRSTGEIIGAVDADNHGSLVYVKHTSRYHKDWIVMFQDELLRVATSDLRGNDLRVYLALLATVDYENTPGLTQRELGELLGIQRTAVNASIRRLRDRGHITLKDNIHYLSLESGWRGRISAYFKALKMRNREVS